LKTFPQPPNRTNLTALYGPIFDLLTAAKSGKILVEVGNPNDQERSEQNSDGRKSNSFKFLEDTEIHKGEVCRSTAATTLVRKLRWSTLGLQFDWSKVCPLSFDASFILDLYVVFSCLIELFQLVVLLILSSDT
jgi:alkylated DNA repair protein alkB family protein 1